MRNATLGSYGITGFVDHDPFDRALRWLGLARPGIGLDLNGELRIDLHVTVAAGLPIAEVGRQVDSAVRYAVRRTVGREIGELTIHVDGLRYRAGDVPMATGSNPATADAVTPSDLTGSGMDLA